MTEVVSDSELRGALSAQLASHSWLSALDGSVPAPPSIGYRTLFAAAERKLKALSDTACPLSRGAFAHLQWLDWARLWLLREGLESVPTEQRAHALDRVFEGGELREQVSTLRVLTQLNQPAQFVETGVSACRTNSVTVFEAIACENPYPAQHFSELSFNQMVMKAVFLDVALGRVIGLQERVGEDLRRMAKDYAAERRAAGRAIPADLSLLGVTMAG